MMAVVGNAVEHVKVWFGSSLVRAGRPRTPRDCDPSPVEWQRAGHLRSRRPRIQVAVHAELEPAVRG
ncbi:hypothetical protein ACIA74_21315 [Streptomyces sp. NPDC051658]|uniref:hypothetical protein n=1 Tax=Streptomyces sp. NPDC051658 TaxID=3365667 RepID=UPI0037B4712B